MAKRIQMILSAKDQASKVVNKFSKNTQSRMKSLAGPLGIGAVSTAFVALTKSTIDYGDKLDKLSQRIGVNVTQMDKLRKVAERANVNFNTLSVGLQRMGRRVSEASKGVGEAKGALQELGLSADRLSRMRPDEQLLEIADAFEKLTNENDRTRIAMKLWDSEGVTFLQFIRGLRKQMNELNSEWTPEKVKQMAMFNTNLTIMMQRMQDVAAKALGPLIKATNDWYKANKKAIDVDIEKWTKGFIESAGELLTWIKQNDTVVEVGLIGWVLFGKKWALIIGAIGKAQSAIGSALQYKPPKSDEERLQRAQDRLTEKLLELNQVRTSIEENKAEGRTARAGQLERDVIPKKLAAIKMERENIAFLTARITGRKVDESLSKFFSEIDARSSLTGGDSGGGGDGGGGSTSKTYKPKTAMKYSEAYNTQLMEEMKAREEHAAEIEKTIQENKANQAIRIAKEKYDKMMEIQETKLSEMGQLWETSTGIMKNNLMDTFSDIIMGTKSVGDAFKQMLYNMLQQIARAAMMQAFQGSGGGGGIFGLISSGIGAVFGAGSGGGAIMNAVPGATSGGVGFSTTPGGQSIHFAPRGAKGGPVEGGQPVYVGENGPELFVPGQTGRILPNQRSGMGGNNFNINVAVENKGQDPAQAARMGTIIGRQIKEQVRMVVKDELRYGGVLNAQNRMAI